MTDSEFTREQWVDVEEAVDQRVKMYAEAERHKDRKTWYALVVILVMSLALNGVMYFVVVHTSRKICGIVVSLDEAYQHNPPTTPVGRDIAVQMRKYRSSLGCG
jgi:hypothetical protein